jgi:hypothetical protein
VAEWGGAGWNRVGWEWGVTVKAGDTCRRRGQEERDGAGRSREGRGWVGSGGTSVGRQWAPTGVVTVCAVKVCVLGGGARAATTAKHMGCMAQVSRLDHGPWPPPGTMHECMWPPPGAFTVARSTPHSIEIISLRLACYSCSTRCCSPAGITTRSAPFRAPSSSASPTCAVTCRHKQKWRSMMFRCLFMRYFVSFMCRRAFCLPCACLLGVNC